MLPAKFQISDLLSPQAVPKKLLCISGILAKAPLQFWRQDFFVCLTFHVVGCPSGILPIPIPTFPLKGKEECSSAKILTLRCCLFDGCLLRQRRHSCSLQPRSNLSFPFKGRVGRERETCSYNDVFPVHRHRDPTLLPLQGEGWDGDGGGQRSCMPSFVSFAVAIQTTPPKAGMVTEIALVQCRHSCSSPSRTENRTPATAVRLRGILRRGRRGRRG
jgi:hypothetical protein